MTPLVPPEVDLRGMEFMPLYGDRLLGSETWIRCSFEGKVAGLRLWWRAYAHEVPASSLPDDDILLADYAGYGVAVKAWRKVKPHAMHGFVLCADGRWYHPVVAELAMKAWALRLRDREKQRRWREKNQGYNGNVTVTKPVEQPGEQPSRHAGEGEGEGEVTDRTVNSKAPTSSGGNPPPLVDIIFGPGLELLKAKGCEERGARSFLGLMRGKHGDEVLYESIEAARRKDIVDPIAWIRKACQARARPGGNGKTNPRAGVARSLNLGADDEHHGAIDGQATRID